MLDKKELHACLSLDGHDKGDKRAEAQQHLHYWLLTD
jgi:hypothetical protein